MTELRTPHTIVLPRRKFILRHGLSWRNRTTLSAINPQSHALSISIKTTFVARCALQVATHGLEQCLVINLDQAGAQVAVVLLFPLRRIFSLFLLFFLSVPSCQFFLDARCFSAWRDSLAACLSRPSCACLCNHTYSCSGICLFSPPKRTYEKKGTKRVAIAGQGKEKAGATVVLGSTADGMLLKTQIVFKGKTERCISKLPRFEEVLLSYVGR